MDKVEVADGVWASRHYALFVEQEDMAVVSDVHLGYEGAMREEGVALPVIQKEIVLERLQGVLDQFDPARLLVNGDFKHTFDRNLEDEWNEVLNVLDFLAGRVEPLMVRGNHDNFLMTILARRDLPLQPRVELGGYTFAHGHAVTKVKGRMVLGHEHPAVKLRDAVGGTVSRHCFLASDDLMLLPAFSPLAGGVDVTSSDWLSPALQGADLAGSSVVAIDDREGLLDFGAVGDVRRARPSLV